jgi:hypothetical protein
MSVGHGTERRQAPRVTVYNGIECRLEIRTRARLLDISLSGALLATELTLPVGAPALLRSSLAATTFRADVQVRRSVSLTSGGPSTGLVAVFTAMDDRSRQGLEDFLRKVSSE